MPERLQVVDENDTPVRIATREQAWENGWILRHAYIVLRDNEGNFLLQQRSAQKKKYPGRWTWAATGHVDAGETYESAAARELFEEVGIKTDLVFLGKIQGIAVNKFGNPSAFISIFTGIISQDTPIVVDPQEVETTRWFSPEELRIIAHTQADTLAPNMRHSFLQFFG